MILLRVITLATKSVSLFHSKLTIDSVEAILNIEAILDIEVVSD